MKRRTPKILLIAGIAVFLAVAGQNAQNPPSKTPNRAPRFEVDPFWPKPLPNHWILGSTVGVTADPNDHIWIIHRPGSLEPAEVRATTTPKIAECCAPAPPVLRFDQSGVLRGYWGGPGLGYDWPITAHGITSDANGNLWLAGSGRGQPPAGAGSVYYHDSMILKFDPSGKFLLQIGKAGASKGSNDMENLGLPAKTFIDSATNEVYVADGYGNRRVAVFDAMTGKYKRHWGAYGRRPDDSNIGAYDPAAGPAQQFRTPVHCAELSNDRLLYVCDRTNNRIQVFRPDGTFVKEALIKKETLGFGAVYDIAFSRDPQQTYIYVADGENNQVHILDRSSLELLTSFGDGGRQPGQFCQVHSIATDSLGNIYTAETARGQRVQKFTYKGLAQITTRYQGVVWPTK